MKTLKELIEKQQTALKAARDICDLAEKEGRDFSVEERNQIKGYLDEANDLKSQIKQMKDDQAMRKQIEEMGEGLEVFDPNGRSKKDVTPSGKIQSVGEQFINSEAWKSWLKSMAPEGRIPDSKKGFNSPSIPVKGFDLFGRKDLLTGADRTSAGAFVQTDYTGIYEPLGRFPLILRQLIDVRQTGSDTVQFVRQVTQVTEAEPTPEANVTEFTGATGQISGAKPEGKMEFEQVTETVKSIPVWIPATKRALSDVAQLRSLIDSELREDVDEELENQLLNGSGTGENFTGLANTAGILVQPFNVDVFVTTRQAITNLKRNGRQIPTAWLLSPEDWETIELEQDGEGRFRYGGPIQRGVPTLWGIPVAQSYFIPEGTAYLGNWRKMVVWDREQTTISVSDSHEDFFVRNMVAILAEMRAAMGVIRPRAFVEVDLQGGS